MSRALNLRVGMNENQKDPNLKPTPLPAVDNKVFLASCPCFFIIVQNLILLVVRIHYRNRTGDVGLSEFTLSVLLTLHLMLEHLLGLLRQVRRMLSIYSHSTKRNLLCLSRLRVVRILLGVMVVVLLEVCPCVVLMIVAGLRCPLVGFLLPLHGVIDLWVLLCKVG